MRNMAIAVGAASTFLAGAAAAEDLDVSGHWWTPDRNSIVRITDCGDGTPCGTVAWVDENSGGMACDEHNRDETLRGRDMVGVVLLEGFHRADDVWRSGQIYNPEDGRTYRARIEIVSKDAIAVSGCLGPICKKLIWERAEGPAVTETRERATSSEEVASL